MKTEKYILAIDSFKGCLSSAEANAAAREGVLQAVPDAEVTSIPVSDGGEGWLEAFHAAQGGTYVETTVSDPFMRPVPASYLMQGEQAIIEIARASGLMLLSPVERNPLLATSYGTGQLICDAVRRGCRDILVGLGGSATSDAGRGMLSALWEDFGRTLEPLADVRFTIAVDVDNPLCGPNGAAHIFGPQKGATPSMIEELDRRALAFATESASQMGYDYSFTPGAGAAGGLGYAFMQYLHGRHRSGIDLLLDTLDFESFIQDADAIITGEGRADGQTLRGKVPMGILRRARSKGIPVILIAGQVENKEQLLAAGFARVECIHPSALPLSEALRPDITRQNISLRIKEIFHN